MSGPFSVPGKWLSLIFCGNLGRLLQEFEPNLL